MCDSNSDGLLPDVDPLAESPMPSFTSVMMNATAECGALPMEIDAHLANFSQHDK